MIQDQNLTMYQKRCLQLKSYLQYRFFMPPKKRTMNQPKNQVELDNQEINLVDNDQSSTRKKSKVSETHFCECGKKYRSLAAVHTHINNKHPDEKKRYKANIVNPKKTGQPAVVSIRMKDISYNEIEAELMCQADESLKIIYESYCNGERNPREDILIDINADLSDDSDIELQGLEGVTLSVTDNKRRKQINQALRVLQERYKMERLIDEKKTDKEFESFKEQKFRLNLLTQLSKFFKPQFAAKIQFSLYLIHTSEKATAQDNLRSQIKATLEQIWRDNADIERQLFNYYEQWNNIRYDYSNWKRNRDRRERNQH